MTKMKLINSTKAQNNFGQIISDTVQNNNRYIIKRHGVPQAILLSINDLEELMISADKRKEAKRVVREVKPKYDIGEVIE